MSGKRNVADTDTTQEYLPFKFEEDYTARRAVRRHGPIEGTETHPKRRPLDNDLEGLQISVQIKACTAAHVNPVIRYEPKPAPFRSGKTYVGRGTPPSAEQGDLKLLRFQRYVGWLRYSGSAQKSKVARSPAWALEVFRRNFRRFAFNETPLPKNRLLCWAKIRRFPQPGAPVPNLGHFTGYAESELEIPLMRILALGNRKRRRALAYEWRKGIKGFETVTTVTQRKGMKQAMMALGVPVHDELCMRSPLRTSWRASSA